jgi:predicted permease
MSERPEWKKEITNRLANLKLDPGREAEIVDELSQHLEDRFQELLSGGAPEDEARKMALQDLSEGDLLARGLQQVEREVMPVQTPLGGGSRKSFLDGLWQDVRYGLRQLRRNPGFTAIAVVTLALGIGANTSIFSIVDALILRPPAIPKAEQIVSLASVLQHGGYSNGFSYPDYEDIRDQSSAVFSQVAGALPLGMDGLSTGGRDEPIFTNYVTGNFFETMGVRPALGSFILPTPGRALADKPVLVLGYSYWKSHFAGNRNAIGRNVLINGHPVTIIGVAPKGFHGPVSFMDTQGYLPIGMARITSDAKSTFSTDRKSGDMFIVARLKSGVKLSAALPILSVIAHRLSGQYPASDKWSSLRAYSLTPFGPMNDPSVLAVLRLMGAFFLLLAGVVLVLACLNVANLVLARGLARQHEIALRAAMGAGRRRLIRQLLTESLLLAFLGCTGGIVVGLASSRLLGSINLRTAIPAVLDFRLDWRVLAYTVGIAVLAGLIVGALPGLRVTRVSLSSLLHEGGRTATAGRHRLRSALIAAQVAGSLMLLIVAGLFVRSLENVQHVNLGFNPRHVLNLSFDPREAGYNKAQTRDLLQALLPRVQSLPGVKSASLAATVPMGYVHLGLQLKINGYQPRSGEQVPWAGYNAVSPGYFRTMRIPIFRGRGIVDADTQNSQRVAVINEAMAQKFWHGENPIGRPFIATDIGTDEPDVSIEIVGVVKNSRTVDLYSAFEPYMYVPLTQRYQTPVTLQILIQLPSSNIVHEAVSEIHSLAAAMPVYDVQTMEQALDTTNGLLLFKLGAALAATLGLLGLTLAIVGVYGVVSYTTNQRTHEIGIRLALGARPIQVLMMVFRKGVLIVGVGIIVGVLLASAVGRLAGNLLIGVAPTDPITYIGASLLLAVVALFACYVPARRAMRVDPVVALRYE